MIGTLGRYVPPDRQQGPSYTREHVARTPRTAREQLEHQARVLGVDADWLSPYALPYWIASIGAVYLLYRWSSS